QLNYTFACTMEAAIYLNSQFRDNQLERVRTQEDLPHDMSILTGYEIPFFRQSSRIKRAIFGGWQAQLIARFSSGRQLGGVDGYPAGIDPRVPGPRGPDLYDFNGCTLNTAAERQNCASADQPVAWVQRPSDTLRVVGTRWGQIREMRPGLMDSSVF